MCHNLEHMFFYHYSNHNNRGTNIISMIDNAGCPDIQALYFQGFGNITAVAITKYIEMCLNMQIFDLFACQIIYRADPKKFDYDS